MRRRALLIVWVAGTVLVSCSKRPEVDGRGVGGEVVDKLYTPATTHIRVGDPAFQLPDRPASWVVKVRTKTGAVETVPIDETGYNRYEVGDRYP